MSIIHDALKKVQQGLSSKSEKIEVIPPAPQPTNASAYIYDTPPKVEQLPPSSQETNNPKPPFQNKIKSILAMCLAMAITAGSLFFVYQQFRNYIPRAQKYVKKSFYKLIHKEDLPDFKNRAPEDLKPLAQLTINPPMEVSSGTTNPSSPLKPPAPITLNVHGIMSDTKGGNLALINDQVYQEGDEVEGAKIVKIDLDSITVIINGTEQTIRVKN
jgi:hypothetical protein